MQPRVLLLLAAVLAAAALATRQGEYCKLCDSHTMCRFRGVNATNCKKGRFSRGLAKGDIENILAEHNRLRNLLASGEETRGSPGPQPAACNMERLSWDKELADVAQRWADQCDYRHDSCRNVPRFYVGQNLALRSQWPCSVVNDSRIWEENVQDWYDEVIDFDRNIVAEYVFDPNVGHYTQIAWAQTKLVGCGFTLYEDGKWCRKYYACNYGPTGNYIGKPVYKQGRPRTDCPEDKPADPAYPALC